MIVEYTGRKGQPDSGMRWWIALVVIILVVLGILG
jgi:hypothetical protein